MWEYKWEIKKVTREIMDVKFVAIHKWSLYDFSVRVIQ